MDISQLVNGVDGHYHLRGIEPGHVLGQVVLVLTEQSENISSNTVVHDKILEGGGREGGGREGVREGGRGREGEREGKYGREGGRERGRKEGGGRERGSGEREREGEGFEG